MKRTRLSMTSLEIIVSDRASFTGALNNSLWLKPTKSCHILSALQHRFISSIDNENWRIDLINESRLMAESVAVCQPFTAEQVDEFHEVFSFFDRCTTGSLQLNELGLILRSVGFNPSDTTIRQYQENYQAQGFDQINFEQFLQILMDFNHTREDEIDLIEAFRVFDQDGHGRKSEETNLSVDRFSARFYHPRTVDAFDDTSGREVLARRSRRNDARCGYLLWWENSLRRICENNDTAELKWKRSSPCSRWWFAGGRRCWQESFLAHR